MTSDASPPVPRHPTEAEVCRLALRHLGEVLGLPARELRPGRYFDVLSEELRQVADEQLLREMDHGTLLITVASYCAQMARCSRIHPDRVAQVLGLAAF